MFSYLLFLENYFISLVEEIFITITTFIVAMKKYLYSTIKKVCNISCAITLTNQYTPIFKINFIKVVTITQYGNINKIQGNIHFYDFTSFFKCDKMFILSIYFGTWKLTGYKLKRFWGTFAYRFQRSQVESGTR